MSTAAPDQTTPARRAVRAFEATLLFAAAPVAHLIWFERVGLQAPMIALFALSGLLLAATPGWRWREVVDPAGLREAVGPILVFSAVVVGAVAVTTLLLRPDDFLSMPRERPRLWLAIMIAYPIVSGLGQEIVYRALFFRRYGDLFASETRLVVANAAAFALAHAFYQNWVALGLTFFGGLGFAWVYRRTRCLPAVILVHAVAGQAIFTFGLGAYFYHGAIPA